jgi:hypothetical protein
VICWSRCDQLGLEAVDQALSSRVVVRVADRSGRAEDAVMQRRYVKSANHVSSGREAAKSRCTRSGLRRASGSAFVVRHGLPRRLAPCRPFSRTKPLHTATAGLLAGTQQRLPHPSGAVCAVVVLVQIPDHAEQPLVLERPGRALTGGTLVVRGRRHAQHPTDRLDPEARAVLLDKRAHFRRCGSSSPAKNTDAALGISFARRSSETSAA